MDVELMTQLLILRKAKRIPSVIVPGTIHCIDQLRNVGSLSSKDALQLRDAYTFLRGVESGISYGGRNRLFVNRVRAP